MGAPSERLLAYLAVHGPARRQRIAGCLWPDSPDPRALANLRAALWRLPNHGRGLITSSLATLALGPAVSTDLSQFNDVVSAALSDRATGAADRVNLLCGVLLPDWDETWLESEREYLRQLGLAALDALAAALLLAGEPIRSVWSPSRAIGQDPLRESSRRAAIAAHLACGNVIEAQRQLEGYRRLLEREIGADPSEHLLAMMHGRDHEATLA